MKTWHIHIEGQVQGVGFRPFTYALAGEFGLHGWVNNTTDGVHIELNAEENIARLFLAELLQKAPEQSRITGHRIFQTDNQFFDQFRIIHSEDLGEPNLLLTPDLALCAACRLELFTEADRRKGYAFTTCTRCGPRYSIIRQLPYDRANTTMEAFPMCAHCRIEFQDPADRRYFAQTNTCPDCRIELSLLHFHHDEPDTLHHQVVDTTVQCWQAGKIVAIKGIGGFLLTCDAANEQAVQRLRTGKHRPSKPLAVMYPDAEMLRQELACDEGEMALLKGSVAPIVLLDRLGTYAPLAPAIAPGLDQTGVMLPYAPLFELLLQKFGRPIVATSGNVSGSPIIYEDEKAVQELSRIADAIVLHKRRIVVPQDDSVLRFTPFKRQKIVLRRSRGLAPTCINPDLQWPRTSILAAGALLKSTFGLLHRGNTYISQYLGDLEQFDTQENYRHTVHHLLTLLKCSPELVLSDLHPGYASTQFAADFAEERRLPIEYVQHHLAHFGAVLGENNLLHSGEPVLGVIWDGTGLGDDGHIWGGEFFRYEAQAFRRCAHFDYFDFILADKMPREPRISALSACHGLPGAEAFLRDKFTATEWPIYSALLEKNNPLRTSSMGRIFDAVASLLGILDKQSYEGEAAQLLETLATRHFRKNGLDMPDSYFPDACDDGIPTRTLLSGIVSDLNDSRPRDFIAAKFHFSLARLVKTIATRQGTRKIAFSGGVFQNGLLVDLMIHHLPEDFQLFFHRQLSPNDENISFGQLICHQIRSQHLSSFQNQSDRHVFSDSR